MECMLERERMLLDLTGSFVGTIMLYQLLSASCFQSASPLLTWSSGDTHLPSARAACAAWQVPGFSPLKAELGETKAGLGGRPVSALAPLPAADLGAGNSGARVWLPPSGETGTEFLAAGWAPEPNPATAAFRE